jgi:hypothetical protein
MSSQKNQASTIENARPQRKRKSKSVITKSCRLICWSLKKDGKMRPETCPECGQPAEVGLDMIGRPCFFHDRKRAGAA